TSYNGIFTHIPVTGGSVQDTIIGYLHGGLRSILTLHVNVPFSLQACGTQHMDSACNKIWNLIVTPPYSDHPETFYLIGGNNDTIVESPPGPGNGTYLYSVHPGNYILVSDSGCNKPIIVDTFRNRPTHVVSYVNCQGLSVIKEFGYDTIPDRPNTITTCAGNSNAAYSIKIFRNGSLVYGPDTTSYANLYTGPIAKYIYPTDTGFYTYQIFWIEYGGGYIDSLGHQYRVGLANIYDTICPVDTGSFYVTRNTIPFPYVQTAYKCNGISSGPPLFTIYGGSIPYTVQIPGIDTIIINTNTGVFPTNNLGTYNVIAYDNCGISRSFTFTIADTCNGCGAVNAGNDTAICHGGTVQLRAAPQQAGGTYLWSPGGETTQTITVSPAASTTYTVTYSKPGCSPAVDSIRVSVLSAPTVVVADVSVCAGRSTVLTASPSVSGGTYLWSPGGATTQSITVSPSATAGYTVSYTVAGCGTATDSATVSIAPPSASGYSQSICTGTSIVFHGQAIGTSGVYYDTLVSATGCDSIVTLTLNVTSLIRTSVSQSVCSGSSIVFHGQAISTAGTYIDTVVSGSGCDTVVTLTLSITPPLATGLDRSICAGDSVDFRGRIVSAAGVYRDTLTGQGGCDSVIALTLTVNPKPVAGFSIQPMGDTIALGPIVVMDISVNSDTVLWLLNDRLIDLASGDTLPVTTTGNYCLRLIASTRLGCTDTSQQCFYVVENAYAMPNAFSPDGNGHNDLFYPVMIRPGISVLVFKVYNRWGELIHDDPSRGWDGKYKGAAQPMEAYTYFLSIELPDAANTGQKKEVKRQGHFMLFR
ncbi:MAG: large protein, partial [Bacteroidetes bacterium]|nr:large protein [Bacteroidota bacterium]